MKRSGNTHKEKRKVKGTLVNSSDGAHFRQSHDRNMDISNNKYPQISKEINNVMKNGEVIKISDIPNKDAGVTQGVKKVMLKDPKTGEKQGAFFKDIQNEPRFIYDSVIKLTDKKTGKEVNQDRDVGRDLNHKRGQGVIGHLVDREIATFALGKALKMDHLPDAAITTAKVDGEDKLGFMVRDIHDQFGEGAKSIVKGAKTDGFRMLESKDKKLGDKLVFDMLIGNVDRHDNNYFVKDGKEMLAFDQGLSFPNNNHEYIQEGFFAMNRFHDAGGIVPLTSDFVKNFGEFLNNGKFEEMRDYVENNVGKMDAEAFTERAVFFADQIFNQKKDKVMDMNFKEHDQNMTPAKKKAVAQYKQYKAGQAKLRAKRNG